MKKSWISVILAVIAFMAVYVALCYMVPGWRLKLEAPAMVYFAASYPELLYRARPATTFLRRTYPDYG